MDIKLVYEIKLREDGEMEFFIKDAQGGELPWNAQAFEVIAVKALAWVQRELLVARFLMALTGQGGPRVMLAGPGGIPPKAN